jgi:hypothetical protein
VQAIDQTLRQEGKRIYGGHVFMAAGQLRESSPGHNSTPATGVTWVGVCILQGSWTACSGTWSC